MNRRRRQSPGGRSEYVNNVNELGYGVRLEVALETVYREEQFLMEVENEFHVAAELWLKARRPKSVDKYGNNWGSLWIDERRARDGWCTWKRL